jgi:adenylate cyclase
MAARAAPLAAAPPGEDQYRLAVRIAYHRGERWINHIRLGLAVAGLVVLGLAGDANTLLANVVLFGQALVWILWVGVVRHQLRQYPNSTPVWLGPASLAVDHAVIAATYLAAQHNGGGIAEYWQGGVLNLFVVINVLGGLRLSPATCAFGGVLTLTINGALLGHSALAHAAILVDHSSYGSAAIHIPDTAVAILVASLPAFGVALVSKLSRQLLLRAETESAKRHALKDEYTRLAKYLPREVVDVVMRDPQRRQLDGQRRAATILFVDIRNFTALAERIPPEETVALLNEFFAVMVEKLFDYEGTLDKFLGDGFMAVFGAPIQVEQAASRSVISAIDMILACQATASFLPGGAGLTMGVGIATGEVISGTIGSPDRLEFTCIGPAVNLASRLEGLNKRLGTTLLIDETTARLLDPAIATVDHGDVLVRGLTSTVRVFSVDALGQDPAKLRTLRDSLRANLVISGTHRG